MDAAKFPRRTGAALAQSMFKNPKVIKELNALCERKTEHLEVCAGFIIGGYLKVLKWALSEDEGDKPKDPALALRALDGITKQLGACFQTARVIHRKQSPKSQL